VRGALPWLAKQVVQTASGLDKDLLIDTFSIALPSDPAETNEGPARGASPTARRDPRPNVRPRPKPPEPVDIPPTPPRVKNLIVEPITGNETGVRVKPGSGCKLSDSFKILFAYERHTSDPFKEYRLFDFDLSPAKKDIEIRANDATVTERRDNIVLFTANAEDFVIEIVGFDPNRDLSYKTRKLQTQSAVGMDGIDEEEDK